MLLLEQNIKGICDRHGLTFRDFLSDMEVEEVNELTVYDLEAIAEEYELDLYALLFKPVFKSFELKEKLQQIKLLVLDVDGVMTDGGMYFDPEGRQSKKFNAKDGLSILHLTKAGFHVAIISSGFEGGAVQARATILGIQHVSVNREPKINRLDRLLAELGLNYSQTAIIGDDINDLTVMRKVGMTIVPSDAVQMVKEAADLILTKKGGEGCIREFIDNYLLDKPIEE
jgi:3-deoxy-D-manno-octulosonate 8-phosphate phosphatase (KDO 8-P phosphatase)